MSKVKIKQLNIGPVSGNNVVPVWTGTEFDDTPITIDFNLNEVNVAGDFSATTKRFLIDHPTKPGFKLQHGNLEGPGLVITSYVKLCGKYSDGNLKRTLKRDQLQKGCLLYKSTMCL